MNTEEARLFRLESSISLLAAQIFPVEILWVRPCLTCQAGNNYFSRSAVDQGRVLGSKFEAMEGHFNNFSNISSVYN